jgi:hypothetical protein
MRNRCALFGVCYGRPCVGLSSFFVTGASPDVLGAQNTFLGSAEQNVCQPRYPSCFMAGSEMNPSMKILRLSTCANMAD